jgi:hypothetical protein
MSPAPNASLPRRENLAGAAVEEGGLEAIDYLLGEFTLINDNATAWETTMQKASSVYYFPIAQCFTPKPA